MNRTIRTHLPGVYLAGSTVSLPPDKTHHLCRVLRLQAGQVLEIFNGQGQVYQAILTKATSKEAMIEIVSVTICTPPSLSIQLGIGLIKPDRFDWMLQKAVELGAAHISPLFTDYTHVRFNADQVEKKNIHWQNIIISAAEQSGQNYLPEFTPILPLSHWIQAHQKHPCLFLDTEPCPSINLTQLEHSDRLGLLIGPEGGFSREERSLCHRQGLLPWYLGPQILRTETAALAGLTLLQYHRNSFNEKTKN